MRISIASSGLALALVFTLVACGDDSSTTDLAGAPDLATDDAGADTDLAVALAITAPDAQLPSIVIGLAAAPITATATGGAPITWSVSAGTLPPGMTLDAATGVYAGTPSALGAYTFTVTATSTAGTDARELMQTVVPPPADAHLLLAGNKLAAFNLDHPTVIGTQQTVIGITAGETLVGIDRRPQNGMLYGLGVDANANTMTLYAIATSSAYATAVGPSFAFTTDGATVVDLPVNGYEIDFNPAADRLRVVTASGLSFRINPNNGAGIDGDNTGVTSGTVTGTNPDGAVNGATTTLHGAAYTNNTANNGALTTLYTIDSTTNRIYIQTPPNVGTQGSGITLAPALTAVRGFDLAPGVNVAASNAAVATGSAYAVATVSGQAGEALVSIDLVTGAVTRLGTLPVTGVLGVAVQRQPSLPIIGLSTNTLFLVRFYRSTPGTAITQTISGVVAGDALVGVDFRPHTGQLYAMGINPTANTATLYIVDPQTGVVTAVGGAGSIAFVDAGGNAVDLPDPAAVAYDIDFNPASDRLRVVAGTGLSFRVNPNTGSPIDGDLGGAAASVTGTNTDASLSGAVTGAAGLAYTNDPGSLVGGLTTAFLIDIVTQKLLHMMVPNGGTTTGTLSITVGGAALVFTAVDGFDIATPVVVPAANAVPATGSGVAALTVGGEVKVYTIDLVTGAATDHGAVGTIVRSLTVGVTAP